MIYITGDIHGDINDYRNNVVNDLNENDIMIFLGDFGFDWDSLHIKFYNSKCTTLFIAGNHENYNILNDLPKKKMFGAEVGVLKENVYYLLNGNIYTIEGKKFLVFGGAVSIDKAYRTPYISWWPQEVPSWEEFEFAKKNLALNNNKVDYLLTHTCNSNISKEFFHYKAPLLDPTEDMINELENQIESPYINYFGHHHVHKMKDNHICLYTEYEELREVPKV